MNTARMKRLTLAASAVIFVGIFVGLGVSNFALRRRLDAAEQQLRTGTTAASTAYSVGELMPSFNAVNREGRAIKLGGATPHGWVLVVVHPKCKHCQTLVQAVSARVAQSTGALSDAQQLAIVSLAPPKRSAELTTGTSPAIPLYFLDRGARLPGYEHIHVVPQIIQIGANGRVAKICKTLEQCTGGSVIEACANCSS